MKRLGYDGSGVPRGIRTWNREPDPAVYEAFVENFDCDLNRPYLVSWKPCLLKDPYNKEVVTLLAGEVFDKIHSRHPARTLKDVFERVRDILKPIRYAELDLREREEAKLSANQAVVDDMALTVEEKKAAKRGRTRRANVRILVVIAISRLISFPLATDGAQDICRDMLRRRDCRWYHRPGGHSH